MLSAISQTQYSKYTVPSFTCESKKNGSLRNRKSKYLRGSKSVMGRSKDDE